MHIHKSHNDRIRQPPPAHPRQREGSHPAALGTKLPSHPAAIGLPGSSLNFVSHRIHQTVYQVSTDMPPASGRETGSQ